MTRVVVLDGSIRRRGLSDDIGGRAIWRTRRCVGRCTSMVRVDAERIPAICSTRVSWPACLVVVVCCAVDGVKTRSCVPCAFVFTQDWGCVVGSVVM